MGTFTASRRRLGVIALSAAVIVAGGLGIAAATSSSAPPSNAKSQGRGIDEYGMTKAYIAGTRVSFTYTKGFFCDTSVRSAASSKCEAGASYKKTPAKDFDPLYITVPLGFSRPMNMIDCPSSLVCVDHPGTIDLSRLEKALKPLYPGVTDRQLTLALKNYPVPGHDHFITTTNGGKAEWWDVQVVGVTSPTVYNHILAHKSYRYIRHLLHNGNKNVLGPIPTNLFLFFSV